MKSEFLLAFNQICSDRGLPPEIVLDALKTALVSAYRRNVGISSAQNVTIEIDQTNGQATIYVEKEAVENVQNEQTEVALEKATTIDPQAQAGDIVMVENTPKDFGRIAAQTAKQVILQRIREAERDALYEDYIGREGEVINGTVQSITSQHISINLGRTEAILPRKEQVPGERYTMHQRIRAYVLEVKRSSRGPQIIISRSHKNMLRRLLELEVPEIYNGVVEIKSIAREAGARSKVAVAATQAGVDPVGSCVGMRGVRIQSIVNELGGEKIDVIEWNPDGATFIAKSLSPARVLTVQLDDPPQGGHTAVVVVPDDQLSLAIGREGQNARLAAKLTGWRIDIKGITEAAQETIKLAAELETDIPGVSEMIPTTMAVLQRHVELQTNYTTEELLLLRQVVDSSHNHFIEQRKAAQAAASDKESARRAILSAEEEARQAKRQAALETIPTTAFDFTLTNLELGSRVVTHLSNAGVENLGQILERLVDGDEGLLALDGIGPKGLAEIKQQIEQVPLPEVEPAQKVEPETPDTEQITEAIEEPLPAAEQEPIVKEPVLVESVEPEPVATVEKDTKETQEPESKPEPVTAKPAGVYYYEDDQELEQVGEQKARRDKQKRRRLVYNEELGEVVAERRRKRGKSEGWDDYE